MCNRGMKEGAAMLNSNAILPSQIILSQISLADIYSGIRTIIREEIAAEKVKDLMEKMLSPAETCKLFNPAISKVTLTKWTNQNLLKDYHFSGRVYYKYSEVVTSGKYLSRYKNAVF